MQNIILKSIFIISIFLIIVSVFPNITLCSWVDDASKFLDASKGVDIGIKKEKLDEASDDIFNMLSSIGMVIAVIVGMILGITFMVTSADEKAKVKESLMPYIIGCIVIFGAFGIWKIMVNTFNGL